MDQSLIDLFSLDGRVAIVTGATKGLGREMALGLSQAGATVVVSSRDQEACDRVAAEIAAETRRDTFGLALHVGDWDAAAPFVDRVVERFGHIDVLVNNAGIQPAVMTMIEIQQAYIDKLYEVNLRGPLRLASLVAPVMAERGKGAILNIASVEAYQGGTATGLYSCLKAALLNATKVMAREMAPLGIRVNALAPGPFDSEMNRAAVRSDPGFKERIEGVTMQRRIADCNEIVGATVYLVSDASSYVTGEDHVVAGGWLR